MNLYSQVDSYCTRQISFLNMSERDSVKEIKRYLDKRLSGLEIKLRNNKNSSSNRKREKDFKYKSNEEQYSFNEQLQGTLEEVQNLLKNGAKHRPSKKLEDCIAQIKRRNKLIRIADKSSGGWDTVKEYESDNVASDSADERKIRAAERRVLSNKKRHQPTVWG